MSRYTNIDRKPDEETMKKIIDRLDCRMVPDRILKAAGKRLGLSETTPYFDGTRWLKRENDNPVFGQLLGRLRRTTPQGKELLRRRQYEERETYYAEANLVEMLKLCCKNSGKPDLSGVDLSGLDLSFASLNGVILSHPGLSDGELDMEKSGSRFGSAAETGLYANLTGSILCSDTFFRQPVGEEGPAATSYMPFHGSVYHISGAGEKVRLSIFYKRDGALYFYCFRDGRQFYPCGCSFPEILNPEETLAIYADWKKKQLLVCDTSGVCYFHLISGKRIADAGRESIPFPKEFSNVRQAEFSPDGKSLDLICGKVGGMERCFCWKFSEESSALIPYPVMPNSRRTLRIASDFHDTEQQIDSGKRYFVTEAKNNVVLSDVFLLNDGVAKRLPPLGECITPCVFCDGKTGGIGYTWDVNPEDMMRREFFERPKRALKEAVRRLRGKKNASNGIFDEKDGAEEDVAEARTFVWFSENQFGKQRRRSADCGIIEPDFYVESSFTAFEGGMVEINGMWVRYYRMEQGKITVHEGEHWCGGWWYGCPGMSD